MTVTVCGFPSLSRVTDWPAASVWTFCSKRLGDGLGTIGAFIQRQHHVHSSSGQHEAGNADYFVYPDAHGAHPIPNDDGKPPAGILGRRLACQERLILGHRSYDPAAHRILHRPDIAGWEPLLPAN